MRVLFLCGSLEPGKDGVGDYTRRIAGQLCNAGYTVALVALNDPFVADIQEETQVDDGATILTLRLAECLPIQKRLQHMQFIAQSLCPDWVSLQYVPYAFHPKGLPFQWISFFAKAVPDANWHIMMHELWIGNKKEESFKNKLIGLVQQHIIRLTFSNIRPKAITTSISFYREHLKKLGYTASVLPVYSNLAYGNIQDLALYQMLPEKVQRNREQYYVAVFFGAVHPFDSTMKYVRTLFEKAEQDGRQVLLVHVGRSGSVNSFFQDIAKQFPAEYLILGEQKAEQIASFFQQADFGVSTYDSRFLGKSGSIAAMLYNRLPVVLLSAAAEEADYDSGKAVAIENITSLQQFTVQPADWHKEYGAEAAAAFYQNIFKLQ